MVYTQIIFFIIYPVICYFFLAKFLYKQEFKKLKTIKDQYNDLEIRHRKQLSDEYLEFRK